MAFDEAEPDQRPIPLPSVLIFTYSFPPAYLKGGPARSVGSLVDMLGSSFDFTVVTSAYDGRDEGPMPAVEPDRWVPWGHGAVWYSSTVRSLASAMFRTLRSRPDVIYLNSLFNVRFSLVPLLLSLLVTPRSVILLAPRGEFSPGALQFRRRDKRWFLAAYRLARLHRRVDWHASSDMEAAHIVGALGEAIRRHVAGPLRSPAHLSLARTDPPGRATAADPLRVVFLSRISPMKNLDGLLRSLAGVSSDVALTIAGPLGDLDHWDRCQDLIGRLPSHVSADVHGPVPGDEVIAFISTFDLFTLPTLGENFGHVILEALLAGTPVIVGANSPWQIIEREGAGWICDPSHPEQLTTLIDRFARLEPTERAAMRAAAARTGQGLATDEGRTADNVRMFNDCASRRRLRSEPRRSRN